MNEGVEGKRQWGIWKKVIVLVVIQGIIQGILSAMYADFAHNFSVVVLGANLTMVCADIIAVLISLFFSLLILSKKFVASDIQDVSRALAATYLGLTIASIVWSAIWGNADAYSSTQILSGGLSIVLIYFGTKVILSRQFKV